MVEWLGDFKDKLVIRTPGAEYSLMIDKADRNSQVLVKLDACVALTGSTPVRCFVIFRLLSPLYMYAGYPIGIYTYIYGVGVILSGHLGIPSLPAVSTSALPNGAVFFSTPAPPFGNFQTIRRARREAGTRPRSPRFTSRAGTPHPPLHQPSGAESTTMNGSSRALVCELHERATRPTR